MEIMDYLEVARRRLWILILIPVLAAIAVGAYVFLSPTQYQGAAVVTVPAMVGGTSSPISGPQGQTTFANTFQATAKSAPVLSAISKQTGVGTTTLQSDLTINVVNNSSIVRVVYTSTKRDQPGAVASATANQTLTFLYGQPVTLAEKSVQSAQTKLSATSSALATITSKAGSSLPDVLYQQKLQQLSNLQERQSEAPSATIAAAITKLQAQTNTLSPLVSQYKAADSAQQAAQTAYNTAEATLTTASQKLAAVRTSQVVNVQPTQEVSLTSQLLHKVLPAIAAGLFLAVALIVVLELLRRRRTAPAADDRGAHAADGREAEEGRWAGTGTPEHAESEVGTRQRG